ncbi:hybrid sensor histidine kinase/response regulator [Crocosphaera sp. XPORK-15E]|uniref:hybrid sensor histidine kinase/response regulator n=1 Tax=Crocosphaera sp. XPORK-15E TaxID=3110247 RepID=UPI002B2088B8|nr:ATP-binding protein [Crocosphaera sp. XPORK-15E]MEA5534571.1 ATP-binding protein [Crocosphaera sp. XPORK-15E]
MKLNFFKYILSKFSLQIVFIVPFVLQIVGTVGLVGYLSFKNGQKSVENLANQLIEETGNRLDLYLTNYLATPTQINQTNVNLVKTGLLNLNNLPQLEKHLFSQLIQFPEVDTIMFGNEQGIFRTFYRNNIFEINKTPQLQGGRSDSANINKLNLYRLNEQGDYLDLFYSYNYLPVKERPWYQDALKNKKAGWTAVFQIGKSSDLAINNYLPLFQKKSSQILGVFSVNLSLNGISKYLKSINITPSAQIFIVETQNDLLIARSDGKPPYKFILKQQEIATKIKRLEPQETDNKLIVITAKYLAEYFKDLQYINQKKELKFCQEGKCYFTKIQPFGDKYGLKWLIITVIPESDFMAEVNANTYRTIILSIAALIISILIGIVISRWLIEPISKLNNAAKNIAQGQWNNTVEIKRNDELGELANSFNLMASQLKESFENLEIKVKERTYELENAREKADTANKAKSAFIANMSHELRTPLNAILGFSQLMTRSQTLSPDNQENATIINRSGEYLLTLINNILDLSKIEAEKITLNPSNFDLYNLLDELDDLFHLRAEKKGLELDFDYTEEVPRYICTDEIKLRQVLINLINNAIKFTNDGGVLVTVNSQEIRDNYEAKASTINLFFEVKDTGEGIETEEIEQLFEAFTQTKSGIKSQEGTGLGLPISQKFVQLMGGDIRVNSQVGIGTTFCWQIPVKLVNAADVESTEIKPNVIALAPHQICYKILVVDDKENNRKLLIKLLQPLGFELKEASNGQEAIKIWDNWEPHLIWMDMRMPIMDGYEATKQIKGTIKGNATAVIALTASVLEEEKAVVLSAGCDDFIRKPFKESVIFETMAKHLGVRYIYEESKEPESQEHSYTLQAEDLRVMSAEWLGQLEQAAINLDDKLMLSLIAQIPPTEQNLSEALRDLVNDFRVDQILGLIKQVK